MKKLFCLFAFFVGSVTLVTAQENAYGNNPFLINLGGGIQRSMWSGFSNAEYLFGLSSEWKLGVGVNADLGIDNGHYLTKEHKAIGSSNWKNSYVYLSPRASIHFLVAPAFALYAGASLYGPVFQRWIVENESIKRNTTYASRLHIGTRYMFTQGFGVFLEGGYHVYGEEGGYGTLGLSVAF